MSLLKTAQRTRTLRNLQRQSIQQGDHRTAWNIGSEVDFNATRVACTYLGHSEIPDTPAGELVREIAFEATLADPERNHTKLISLLRQAMCSNDQKTVTKLRRAKRHLPDLDFIEQRLS